MGLADPRRKVSPRSPSQSRTAVPARRRARRPADASKAPGVRASAALAATLDPIITIDERGTIQSASDSIQRLLGWKPNELIGRNVSVLMPEPHRSAHDGYLRAYARSGETNILNRPRRFEALHRNGSRVPIELCVSRADLPDGGGPLFVGILRDMSVVAEVERTLHEERVRWQKQLAEQTAALQAAHLRLRMADRMASIGTLAAGLGHDMNNVLLPVRARLGSLRAAAARGEIPAREREHIEELRTSIAYLQQLADGLHFLARDPETHEDEPAETTDVHRWWSQVGSLICKAVPSHVCVRAKIAPNLPRITVAPHRLTQAVLNLVVNAGEAIPPERRRGIVRVAAAPCNGPPRVCFTVTDNGVGMSEEVQRRAFEMFFTTKRRGMATGLGLPLVRRVVLHAGGSIALRSAPAKGTRVTMIFPAAPRPPRPRPPARAALLLRDRRLESLVRHLLTPLGIAPAGGDAALADIWIADRDSASLQSVTRWRRKRPKGRLVLLGRAPAADNDPWKKFSPIVVDNPDELTEVRRALRAAAEAP